MACPLCARRASFSRRLRPSSNASRARTIATARQTTSSAMCAAAMACASLGCARYWCEDGRNGIVRTGPRSWAFGRCSGRTRSCQRGHGSSYGYNERSTWRTPWVDALPDAILAFWVQLQATPEERQRAVDAHAAYLVEWGGSQKQFGAGKQGEGDAVIEL